MKINILAPGMELTPAIREFVEKKVGMIEKHLEGAIDIVAQVEVGKTTQHHKSGEYFKAEIHLIGSGYDLFSKSERDDLYAAIDEVKDEIIRKLSDKKGKEWALTRRGAAMMKSAMKGFTWSVGKLKGFRRRKGGEPEV